MRTSRCHLVKSSDWKVSSKISFPAQVDRPPFTVVTVGSHGGRVVVVVVVVVLVLLPFVFPSFGAFVVVTAFGFWVVVVVVVVTGFFLMSSFRFVA